MRQVRVRRKAVSLGEASVPTKVALFAFSAIVQGNPSSAMTAYWMVRDSTQRLNWWLP